MKKKIIPLLVMFGLVILTVSIGYLVFNTIANAPGNTSSINASLESTATVYNIIGPIIGVIVGIVFITILLYWVSNKERFSIPFKAVEYFSEVLIYFGYGLASIVIFVVPAYLIILTSQFAIENSASTIPFLITIGKVVAIFFGVAGIGYLGKRFFFNKLENRLEEREYQKNASDLPGGFKQ